MRVSSTPPTCGPSPRAGSSSGSASGIKSADAGVWLPSVPGSHGCVVAEPKLLPRRGSYGPSVPGSALRTDRGPSWPRGVRVRVSPIPHLLRPGLTGIRTVGAAGCAIEPCAVDNRSPRRPSLQGHHCLSSTAYRPAVRLTRPVVRPLRLNSATPAPARLPRQLAWDHSRRVALDLEPASGELVLLLCDRVGELDGVISSQVTDRSQGVHPPFFYPQLTHRLLHRFTCGFVGCAHSCGTNLWISRCPAGCGDAG